MSLFNERLISSSCFIGKGDSGNGQLDGRRVWRTKKMLRASVALLQVNFELSYFAFLDAGLL